MASFQRQTLGVICGAQFTGKSTLGDRLREELSIPFLAVDRFRPLMFGKTAFDAEGDRHQLSRAYPVMRSAADVLLGLGDSVLMEATFSKAVYQTQNIQFLTERHPDIAVKIILLTIPEACERAVVEVRAAERPSDNPSASRTYEDYLRVKGRFEPIIYSHRVIDTTRPFEACVRDAMGYLLAP